MYEEVDYTCCLVVPSVIAARMYLAKYTEELLKTLKVLLLSAMRALRFKTSSIVKDDFVKAGKTAPKVSIFNNYSSPRADSHVGA